MSQEIDFDARYTVANWPGVAVYIHGWPQVWEPYTFLAWCNEDTGEFCDEGDEGAIEAEIDSDEGEWADDTTSGQIIVVMVGDDRKHTVDVDDLTKLDDLDYCAECGQIGCCHDGRDRG